MTELIEIILPIFSVANFFFLYYVQNTFSIVSFVGIMIGVIHAFLPMQMFNEFLFKLKEPKPNEMLYDEVYEDF